MLMFHPFLKRAFALAITATVAGCVHPGVDQRALADLAAMPPADISEATLRDVTQRLASDEFEGRAPGTPGEEKTLAYLVDRFAAVGLQPGNQGSWFQDVPLVELTAEALSPLEIEGKGATLALAPGSGWVGVSYREEPVINLANSEIVFVGYGINAPEKGWNDYAGLDMHGKVALILVNDPDYESPETTGLFDGRAMTYYGRWTYKFEEAARQGAAAALIIHDDFPAAYGWNVVESSWSGPQSHARRPRGGADEPLVNGWVSKPSAEAIMRAAGLDLRQMQRAASRRGFRPVSLGLTASTGFTNVIRPFESKNVVGLLPGTQRPEEYVLYTAHWDHLGRCTANEAGDDICNGAIDNATGTAALVALAEGHVRAGPADRSLVFLAVTAEEQGLLGSEFYGADPVFPLSQTVGGVNMDALYPTPPARDVEVVGAGKSALDGYLDAALRALGRRATRDAAPEAGYYYRSDHFSLAKRGVPMFYVKTGKDLIDGGRAAGQAFAAHYRDNVYHGPEDEFDPDWKWDGMILDLQLYFRLGRMLANSGDWPNWYAHDEFRHIRDASCRAGEGC